MKNKNDGLESKVEVFPKGSFKQDRNGTYFPFCSYGQHRGLIKEELICTSRCCDYYTKIYIRYGGEIKNKKKRK